MIGTQQLKELQERLTHLDRGLVLAHRANPTDSQIMELSGLHEKACEEWERARSTTGSDERQEAYNKALELADQIVLPPALQPLAPAAAPRSPGATSPSRASWVETLRGAFGLPTERRNS